MILLAPGGVRGHPGGVDYRTCQRALIIGPEQVIGRCQATWLSDVLSGLIRAYYRTKKKRDFVLDLWSILWYTCRVNSVVH